MITRRSVLGLLSASALSAIATPAAPAEPMLARLTIVVAFPAGGATDIVARQVADGLRGTYAEAVVVENRVGGTGRVAAVYVKSAPADGSVLLFSPAFPMAIFPHIYKTLPYDALNDFVPVATTSKGAFAFSVGPGVPESVHGLADFVAWARANPDKANFGAPNGGGQHFAGMLFARQAGIALKMVAYKGGAQSVIDVQGGHIASVVTPIPEVLPLAREGRLRMLATTTEQRSPFTPQVPTMKELGYDVVFQDWSGFLAPAHTPPEVVARANAAISEAVGSSRVKAALLAQGTDADIRSPAEFARLYRQAWARYRDIVKTTGFKAED